MSASAGAGCISRNRRGVTHPGALDQHILRQREDDRAGPAVDRGVEGAGDHLRDPLRILDLADPLRQLAVHAPVVDFLEGLPVRRGAGDLADEQDHRRRILEGDVHAGAGVGRARPAGHEADAGRAGQLAVGFRHDRRAALLACGHDMDLRHVDKGVQNGEIAFAGHAEHALDAVDAQLVDKDLSAGSEIVRLGVRSVAHEGSGFGVHLPLAPFAGPAEASVRPAPHQQRAAPGTAWDARAASGSCRPVAPGDLAGPPEAG